MTFATEQRSKMCQYDVPCEMSSPDLGMGMINGDFDIARM